MEQERDRDIPLYVGCLSWELDREEEREYEVEG